MKVSIDLIMLSLHATFTESSLWTKCSNPRYVFEKLGFMFKHNCLISTNMSQVELFVSIFPIIHGYLQIIQFLDIPKYTLHLITLFMEEQILSYIFDFKKIQSQNSYVFNLSFSFDHITPEISKLVFPIIIGLMIVLGSKQSTRLN